MKLRKLSELFDPKEMLRALFWAIIIELMKKILTVRRFRNFMDALVRPYSDITKVCLNGGAFIMPICEFHKRIIHPICQFYCQNYAKDPIKKYCVFMDVDDYITFLIKRLSKKKHKRLSERLSWLLVQNGRDVWFLLRGRKFPINFFKSLIMLISLLLVTIRNLPYIKRINPSPKNVKFS